MTLIGCHNLNTLTLKRIFSIRPGLQKVKNFNILVAQYMNVKELCGVANLCYANFQSFKVFYSTRALQ